MKSTLQQILTTKNIRATLPVILVNTIGDLTFYLKWEGVLFNCIMLLFAFAWSICVILQIAFKLPKTQPAGTLPQVLSAKPWPKQAIFAKLSQ